jgi:short subunit dehydrogenase-like uncharacterized protein
MQFKYNEKAKDSKIFVVGTCGFDSIPADMGIVYTEKKFPGREMSSHNCKRWYREKHYA